MDNYLWPYWLNSEAYNFGFWGTDESYNRLMTWLQCILSVNLDKSGYFVYFYGFQFFGYISLFKNSNPTLSLRSAPFSFHARRAICLGAISKVRFWKTWIFQIIKINLPQWFDLQTWVQRARRVSQCQVTWHMFRAADRNLGGIFPCSQPMRGRD